VALAARLCYSSRTVGELDEELNEGEIDSLLKLLLRQGHTSPFEHASFTFGMEASRACLNQLVRHRIASYSQQSQRYVKADNLACVMPPTVSQDSCARAIVEQVTEQARRAYSELLQMGIPKEDARYVLPVGAVSRLVATFNARSLHNLFALRCCERAQWEIRDIAREMLSLVREVAPRLFARAGSPCEALGVCREGAMSCGKLARLRAARDKS
jgi:thymidylate synthase (FAD)